MHLLFNPKNPVRNAIILYFIIVYLTYYYKPNIIFGKELYLSSEEF